MTVGRYLVDTDVLIDYLRGVPQAVDFLEEAPEALLISAVSVGELFAGVREGAERSALDAFLGAFEVVPLDRESAEKGGLFRRDFGRSHNVGLPDALIAASAELRGARLVTLNRKHFPMLPDVLVPYSKTAGG
jgi:hypothetical protein